MGSTIPTTRVHPSFKQSIRVVPCSPVVGLRPTPLTGHNTGSILSGLGRISVGVAVAS